MTDRTAPKGMRKGLTRYGDEDFSLFLRKAFIKAMGFSDDALSRPIVGIADTGSDYNACHATVPKLVEAVKRGVMLAGGLPMAFPTISLHESFAHPTSMFLRNLMAMDTEEMVRAQPMDAVVLIGGCDKTIPAQLMAAASAGVPALVIPTGPMMTGHYRGERLGACTDCRRFWGMYRAGELDDAEIEDVNDRLCPTAGTCMVMGTASTMACMTEALGMMLPGGATIPAVYADRVRYAELSGRRAVEIAAENLRPERILTADAFHNSLVTLQAIGGSTNGLVHITAVANRVGIPIDLDEFDAIGRRVPVLVDLKPSGDHYMEHLHDAGGLNAVLRELRSELRTEALTVSGRTLGENIEQGDRVPGQTVVRARSDPIYPTGGMAALRGNIAPGGAIIKHAAASPRLLSHTGRAVVFDSLDDLAARIDDPALEVEPEDVLVLRGAGPKGAPGMPEAGYIPIPEEARRPRCEGHGAHFGRPNERHRVRHHRASRQPRVRGRGTARARPDRRPHPPRCSGAASRSAGARGGTRGTARTLDPSSAPCRFGARLPAALPRYRHPGGSRVRLRLHGRRPRPSTPSGGMIAGV